MAHDAETKELEDLLKMLIEWSDLGAATAQHIVFCDTCVLAERNKTPYCTTGNELWDKQMKIEAKLQELSPRFKAHGVDFDREFAKTGFQFFESHK